ncbi:MAG: NADH-quinone oxidoreductase subunit NuoH [Acidobacteriota bacterium]|nr:NADH-quinone oxidoreductase subunit NuoH [Acidobacteriota bacterium]
MPQGLEPILINAAKIFAIANALMASVAILTWIERRLSAIIQFRLGPNRVGPAGLFQPLADGIKFFMKEETIPADARKGVFIIAPFIALVSALTAFAVIPIGTQIEIAGRVIDLVILDLDGGLLVALAASSLGVYGIVCAGWASNSKYALMGGLRASAQMISYELALGLSIVGVLIVSGTLRPTEIVALQAGSPWQWNIFGGGWQLLGFMIFMVAGYAETNRLPFDMPEAESELVAGYHTEYSSMKFSMFFMAEYIAMITISGMAVTLFLGGYLTGIPALDTMGGILGALIQIGTFVTKVGFFLILFVWVRWTLPRFRYDQLMDLGWKRLFPLALLNLLVTALLVAFDIV